LIDLLCLLGVGKTKGPEFIFLLAGSIHGVKYSHARAKLIENIKNKQLEDMKRKQNGEIELGDDLFTQFIRKENKIFKHNLHKKKNDNDNNNNDDNNNDNDNSKDNNNDDDKSNNQNIKYHDNGGNDHSSIIIPNHPCSITSLSIADNELGKEPSYFTCTIV